MTPLLQYHIINENVTRVKVNGDQKLQSKVQGPKSLVLNWGTKNLKTPKYERGPNVHLGHENKIA